MNDSNLLVAFTRNSNKFWARVFCRHFRHCVVLFPMDAQYILVQIGIDGVRLFAVDAAAIRRMKRAGWVFVKVVGADNYPPRARKRALYRAQYIAPLQLLTCVGFAKRAVGIRASFIWTPDQLYKHLHHRRKCL